MKMFIREICAPKLLRLSVFGGRFRSTKPNLECTFSEAEKLVGYTSSSKISRWLLNNEIAKRNSQLCEFANHSSLQTPKHFSQNGKNSIQTWGLVVLLMSKVAGRVPEEVLAEVTEMIRIAFIVHTSFENHQYSSLDKIRLLTGDYLLSQVFVELAKLRNQRVTELISSAVRDLVEGEFVGERDEHKNALPYKPSKVPFRGLSDLDDDHFESDCERPLNFGKYIGIPDKEWEARQMLNAGSLLAKSCQCSLILAGYSKDLQKHGYFFGKHFALAWQAFEDRQFFDKSCLEDGSTFSLIGAPVLFHLNYDLSSYAEIVKGKESIDNINYKKLYTMIRSGPALEFTKALQLKHTSRAKKELECFPISEARTSLEDILSALEDI